jgi:hypothetical protein
VKEPIFLVSRLSSRAGGVGEVVEHLPSKCEALGSSSSTSKKTKPNQTPNKQSSLSSNLLQDYTGPMKY